MCQCVCCNCWWVNIMGVCCGGLHSACCLASCWMCQPDDLYNIAPDCCICCYCTGIGGNTCCLGNVCCAPEYLTIWSNQRNLMMGGMMGGGGPNVIIINNTEPSYGVTYQGVPPVYNQNLNKGYNPGYNQAYNQGYNQGYNYGGNSNPNYVNNYAIGYRN